MFETAFMALIGAAIYRARGIGLWPSRPWWHLVFALPFGIVAFSAVDWFSGVLVWGVTTGAVLTGHASYLRLGDRSSTPGDGDQDEWYGRWIPFDPFWHDLTGLAVSGILVTAPCGVALILSGHIGAGLLLTLSGALKATGYATAAVLARNTHLGTTVSIGECLTGGFLWGALAACA